MQATSAIMIAQLVRDLATATDKALGEPHDYLEMENRRGRWLALAQILEPHIEQASAICCDLLADLRPHGGRALPNSLRAMLSSSQDKDSKLMALTDNLMEDVAALEALLRKGELDEIPQSMHVMRLLIGAHGFAAMMFSVVYTAMSSAPYDVEYLLEDKWTGFMRHSKMRQTQTRGVAVVYACWQTHVRLRGDSRRTKEQSHREAAQFLAMALAQLALIHFDIGGEALMRSCIQSQVSRLQELTAAA